MSTLESLGITKLEAAHWYVHDIERTRQFYTTRLDFAEIAQSSEDFTQHTKQRSVVFQAGDVTLLCSAPEGEGGRAWRWLKHHPEGVGTIIFQVEDIEKTHRLLDARGGTFITEILVSRDDRGGFMKHFSITTPFGNTTFRFVQREGYAPLFEGMEHHAQPKGGNNRWGFSHIDHITSNFRTLKPMVLWMEHVLGFQEFWSIQFHTEDEIERNQEQGSGLKSVVMWDPKSKIKFANNEPAGPKFKASQINVFVEDNAGEGVQHLALGVRDILSAVRGLRVTEGIEFLSTPEAYYKYLPERLETSGIKRIDERLEDLQQLQILIDGNKEHRYLLQIFMKDKASLFHDREAGPFFYELIQRKGDPGFGGGNFRALFESIEREQRAGGRV